MLNWAIRYSSAVQLVDELHPRSVLDVGSGDHGVNLYRTYDLVVRTDLLMPKSTPTPGPFVVASALELPFADKAVDVVLSLDLIEHLAVAERGTAVAEMCRVAGRHVVLGFPVGSIARRTDAAFAALLRSTRRPMPDWLAEHRQVEYPEREAFLHLVPQGWKVARELRNANAVLHSLSVLADSSRHTADRAERLGRRIAIKGAPRGSHSWPAYRKMYVLDRV